VPGMRGLLEKFAARVAAATVFDRQSSEVLLRSTAEEQGLKPAALIHATRVAVTGRSISPGLYEVLELLGQTRVVSRLAHAASLAHE
jgi:glutamyl/glutaminyl-tRNA synthetase